MSQLAELKKLQVKTRDFKIPKNPREGEEQATITFTALALDDLKLLSFDKNTSEEKTMEGMYKALAKSLSTKDEPVSIEDVGVLSMEYMMDLMDCLMEVNNFDSVDKEKMDKVKGMLAKKNGKSDTNSEE